MTRDYIVEATAAGIQTWIVPARSRAEAIRMVKQDVAPVKPVGFEVTHTHWSTLTATPDKTINKES